AQYERFGFKGFLKEVEDAPAPPAPPAAADKRRVRTILSEAELRDLALKLEAAGLVGFAFAFADEAVYLPLAHDYPGAPAQIDALKTLRPWLERADCRKAGENVKRDSHLLANQGIALAGCVHDVQLESYVLEVHERHDLGSLAQRHCGWTTLSAEEV